MQDTRAKHGVDEVQLGRAAVGEHDEHILAHRARERIGGGDRFARPNAARIERGVKDANAVQDRHALRRPGQGNGRRRVRQRNPPKIGHEVHDFDEQPPNGIAAPIIARLKNVLHMALDLLRVVLVQYRHRLAPPRSAGVPARRAALARVTLILAFSHQGRRDLSLAILAWFQVSGLAAILRIPVFAGMNGRITAQKADFRIAQAGAARKPAPSE